MAVIKGISNFGTPYYTDEPRYERKNGQWVDTKAGAIDELEKIKAEIIENQCISCGLTCIPYGDCKYYECIEVKEVIECLELIDKHIAELKGE